MATVLKSKRRPASSKAKVKTTKAAAKKQTKTPARRVADKKSGKKKISSKVKVTAARPTEVDSQAQYVKAIGYLMSHTDYEKMRVVRYNTTTFSLDRMRTLLKHLGDPQTKFKTAHIAGTK
ncbi:MAG: hypothetical protein FWD53_04430, partial [Phycisphaerales bacterium]|nr:hypothetical protein [Phycisphaerales bacterium]